MNIKKFNDDIAESLLEACKHLGDFQLFIEVSKLNQDSTIEKELSRYFEDYFSDRTIQDLVFEYEGPFKSYDVLINAIEKWFKFSGLGVIKGRESIRLTLEFLSKLEKPLHCYKIDKYSYTKKDTKGRKVHSLDYDYFLLRNNSQTVAFEIGGDD